MALHNNIIIKTHIITSPNTNISALPLAKRLNATMIAIISKTIAKDANNIIISPPIKGHAFIAKTKEPMLY